MSDAREPPPVPPGPGVQPPFIAPPMEGRTARRWLAAGVAAALVAACCGIGGLAVGGLVVATIPAANEQAQAAVGDYLDALADEDWTGAYELRCDADREAESEAEFTRRVSDGPRIESYELGSIDWFAAEGSSLELPAEVAYADGSRQDRTYPLAQDPSTGTLQVCRHA